MATSYSRADDVLDSTLLQPLPSLGGSSSNDKGKQRQQHRPHEYKVAEETDSGAAEGEGGGRLPLAFAQLRPSLEDPTNSNKAGDDAEADQQQQATGNAGAAATTSSSKQQQELIRVSPPASANSREFTMLRLYNLSDELAARLVAGMDLTYEEFPFRCHLPQRGLRSSCRPLLARNVAEITCDVNCLMMRPQRQGCYQQ
jgi:hypothetical protein